MTEKLALDFVAFFPIDYIMLALGVPIIFISWIRVIFLTIRNSNLFPFSC